MTKKVKFVVDNTNDQKLQMAAAALTLGFPYGNVVETYEESRTESAYEFSVNLLDLPDLRHVVELLQRCGINVREERPD